MNSSPPRPAAPVVPALAPLESGSPAPLDFESVQDAWHFAVGSAIRHPWILFVGICGGLLVGAAFARVLPKTYHVECQILAQRNLIMPALGNPHRSVPLDSDNPTQDASETVLTRDNLVDLVKHTALLERWQAERAPILRFKDLLLTSRKPPTDAQRLEALLGILEKRIHVQSDEATVTLSIDWPGARTAADLLQQAEENFLQARHTSEVSSIAETVKILEDHATRVRETIEANYAQLERGKEEEAADARAPAPSQPAHPSDSEPPLPKTLKEADLRLAEIERKEFPQDVDDDDDAQSVDPAKLSPRELERQREQAVDPEKEAERQERDARKVDYPKARLKVAFDNYDELQRRIDAARIELDTAEAAFKYRYQVIQPVIVPERPSSPNTPALVIAGALLGLLVGLFFAFGRDAPGTLIGAPWQVEHYFKVPVLADLRKR